MRRCIYILINRIRAEARSFYSFHLCKHDPDLLTRRHEPGGGSGDGERRGHLLRDGRGRRGLGGGCISIRLFVWTLCVFCVYVTGPLAVFVCNTSPSPPPIHNTQAAAYVAGCGMLTARLGAYCTSRLSAATLKRLCVRAFVGVVCMDMRGSIAGRAFIRRSTCKQINIIYRAPSRSSSPRWSPSGALWLIFCIYHSTTTTTLTCIHTYTKQRPDRGLLQGRGQRGGGRRAKGRGSRDVAASALAHGHRDGERVRREGVNFGRESDRIRAYWWSHTPITDRLESNG